MSTPALLAPVPGCTRWRERPYREHLRLRDGRRLPTYDWVVTPGEGTGPIAGR